MNEATDWGTHFSWFLEKRKSELSKIKFFITQKFIRYMGYKGKIYSEKIAKTKDDYRTVKQIYRSLRINYKIMDPGASAYFFYRENHCEIVSLHSNLNPAIWIGLLWEKISCYGTAPLRLLSLLTCFILSCSFIYYIVPNGIVRASSQGSNVAIKNFGEALYFSIVTFTSLGFGDFHPNHESIWGQYLKYLCCFEALIGVTSIALFTAIFIKFMSK